MNMKQGLKHGIVSSSIENENLVEDGVESILLLVSIIIL